MLETEALRLSIRHGGAAWEAALVAAFERLSEAECSPEHMRGADWEDANRAFHEALIAGHDSPWSRYLLGILYRHAERYRYIAMRVVSADSGWTVADRAGVCVGAHSHILLMGTSSALWLSAPQPETYTAHATASPAVQSNKVYHAPWFAVPSIPVRAGA